MVHNRPSKTLVSAGVLVYLFLYIPLAVVVIFSFNDSKLNAEWVGFTWKWYEKLIHNENILRAAGNSLIIAIISAAMATVLGTLAGLAIHRGRQKWLPALVLGPIAMPDILIGVSLLLMFILLNISLGSVSIILAHVSFCIGFVALAVQSRLAGMDQSLIEAARDLGASPWQSFRLISLPLLMPGIIAGALMAFTLSIDDFVITFFTAGVGSSTLPLEIYSMVKIAVTPEVNAVSTLLMLVTLTLITLLSKISPAVLRQ
ncbi:MAG: spermidine/putrescine transport system permease protein [Zhongshania aliphaticivorans]|jgi:spermidine/putrescine transport system permease protein|uniref:ABC transporter permease n=1 Tax=Zhongshania aliphaticivorans TaxID=1470434 RepID=UPI0039E679B5|tara:strand:+ start:10332 stop:11108 length:777 start_codon:yes stop_codon:yes gene_type:complete